MKKQDKTIDLIITQKIEPIKNIPFPEAVRKERAPELSGNMHKGKKQGTFLDIIYELKERVKKDLNSRIKELLATESLTVENFPVTMKTLDDIYLRYIKEYEKFGYLDLTNSGQSVINDDELIRKTFNREINGFLKNCFWIRYYKMSLK